MILVLLGTFPLPFERPLHELEKAINDGLIKEEIIVQSGHTVFESQEMIFRPFIPLDELLSLYDRADLIISQAGTGSLIKGLRKNKKIIGIARLAKFGESVDDHQVELLNEFSSSGYIFPWHENDDFGKIYKQIAHFQPKQFISDNTKITEFLTNYIDSI